MTMMKKTWMRPLSWGCCGWTGRTPKGVTGMIVLGFLFCFFLVVVKMMNDDDAQFMYLVQWLRVVICDTARLRLSNKWSQKAFWAKSHGFQWWLFLGFRENYFVNNDNGLENQQDLDFYCKLPPLLSHFLASGATFQATGVIILISMMNWNFYNRTGGL